MRIPLASNLRSRDGTVTKDAKVKNGIIEVEGEKLKLRKRPGISDAGLLREGFAQALTHWLGKVVAIIGDYLNVSLTGLIPTNISTTLNPSDKGVNVTLSNGNLTATCSNLGMVRSIATVSTGLWYFEVTISNFTESYVGMANLTATTAEGPGRDAHGIGYHRGGSIIKGGSTVTSGASYTNGDIIGVLYDADADTLKFYKNNALQATITAANLPTGALYASVGAGPGAAAMTVNFGPTFTYSPGGSSSNLSPTTAGLPFSVQDNGRNAPKLYLMLKNSGQAWAVDDSFNVTEITDTDYPGTYTVTLTSLTRSGSTATATTAVDTNFQVGSTVTIAGAGQAEYNGAKTILSVTPSSTNPAGSKDISVTITRSGSTATATSVSEPHGLVTGDQVTIEGADQVEYNGVKTVTWVSATQFTFPVTVTSGAAAYPATPATGSPAFQSPAWGPVGLTTAWNDSLSSAGTNSDVTNFRLYVPTYPNGRRAAFFRVGASVVITSSSLNQSDGGGAAPSINGTYTITRYENGFVHFTVPGNAEHVYGTAKVQVSVPSISSVTFSSAGGPPRATVTTSAAHGLSVADYFAIEGATQSEYNGFNEVSSVPSSTTFTYNINRYGAATADSPATPATGEIKFTKDIPASVNGASFTYTVSGTPATPATGTITATGGRSTVPGIAYLDGYFAVMDVNGVIYNSKEDDPTAWEPLEYTIAQAESGSGKFIARSVNYIIAGKEWTLELFYNAANEPPGSPLSPVPNGLIQVGCATGFSLAQLDGALYWMSQTKQGGRGVHVMAGLEQRKVSTPDVDRILKEDDLSEVHAFGVRLAGHSLYVLTLVKSNITLVYDATSDAWSEWSSYTLGSAVSVSSITRSGTTATVTFGSAHGLSDGDPVLIAGANQSDYNGIKQVQRVSSTVVTFDVSGSPATPATGTITGTPYTESYFKFTKAANLNGDDGLLHRTDGHLYKFLASLYQDNGLPINLFARTARMDGGSTGRKTMPRIGVIADTASSIAMIRWSDDDCTTYSAYRIVDLSKEEPEIRRCGGFKRRTIEFRHVGNTAVNASDLEVA